MIRYFFSFLLTAAPLLHSQVSNVRQTVDHGRIIISYDLLGSDEQEYDIGITATNENGENITPHAIVGDLATVKPCQGLSIWWETLLDGLTPIGWKISLTAKKSLIVWVLVQGGPGGDFYISATEVTFEQYDTFCDATGYQKPKADFGRGKQPVINVNVADAVAFCKWLSKESGITIRLPEEKEWEYAAKGGNKSKGYDYSGSNTIDEVAWYNGNSNGSTHEVRTKQPNELGIYDMSGNVLEWCGTSGAIRGGSWLSGVPRCRVPNRYDGNSTERVDDIGFRVLKKP